MEGKGESGYGEEVGSNESIYHSQDATILAMCSFTNWGAFKDIEGKFWEKVFSFSKGITVWMFLLSMVNNCLFASEIHDRSK